MGQVVLETAVVDADTDNDDEDDEVALARGQEGPEPEDDELADNEMALAAGADRAKLHSGRTDGRASCTATMHYCA